MGNLILNTMTKHSNDFDIANNEVERLEKEAIEMFEKTELTSNGTSYVLGYMKGHLRTALVKIAKLEKELNKN